MNNGRLVEIYQQPILGRLFVVGDIHGCYALLMKQLELIRFDFTQDLLISVGDVVDRGADSLKCLNLIHEPWFKAIRGNHEQYCIDSTLDNTLKPIHIKHGGAWLYQLSEDQQREIVGMCLDLPVVLEVNYHDKKYGFVHADISINDWEQFKLAIHTDDYLTNSDSAQVLALWYHGRIHQTQSDTHYQLVENVDEIYLGHTVVDQPKQYQNCFFIDTGAVFGGKLTIKELVGK